MQAPFVVQTPTLAERESIFRMVALGSYVLCLTTYLTF